MALTVQILLPSEPTIELIELIPAKSKSTPSVADSVEQSIAEEAVNVQLIVLELEVAPDLSSSSLMASPSTTSALFALSDPEVPGSLRVRTALFPAVSAIVPPFSSSELLAT